MTHWLQMAGWGALGCGAVVVLAFAITSAREREWRAFAITLLGGVVALTPLGVLMVLRFPGQQHAVSTVLVLGVLAALVLMLPLGRARPIRVVGEQPRVDERDALFHRFYRLEPGTPEFEAYYEAHPDQRAFDERVRAMPQLAAPDSRAYRPESAPFAVALADAVEKVNVDLDRPLAPLADARVERSPDELTRRVKGFARHVGARQVGCTALNPAYVYSHIARGPGEWGAPIALDHTHAVAIAVEMDPALIRCAPALPTLVESTHKYLTSATVAVAVAGYLQRLGYRARAHVDANYRVMVVPVAVDAGLGELGRLGLLMTPHHGPRVRLAVVTTDAPLRQDAPADFGGAAFCERCLKCADACPANAISREARQVHAGVEKWQSRDDTCYRYWRTQGTDCAVCIKVCPFSHPTGAVHEVVRWAIRHNALARRLARWGDDLCYGRAPREHAPPEWL